MVEIWFSILLEIPDKCCLRCSNCSCKDLRTVDVLVTLIVCVLQLICVGHVIVLKLLL